MSFPTTLDNLPLPLAATLEDDTGFEHDLVHQGLANAIMAMQTVMGITGSLVTSTIAYRLDHLAPSFANITSGTNTGATMVVGAGASLSATLGQTSNEIFGAGAGAAIASGATNNTALGCNALASQVNADGNTAVGQAALNLATGASNTAVGSNAGVGVVTSNSNTAIGSGAMAAGDFGDQNIAIGQSSMLGASAAGAAAARNIVIGAGAAGAIVDATDNVIIGTAAAAALQSGSSNILISSSSAYTMTDGNNNIAIGNGALNIFDGGDENTVIGAYSMPGSGTMTGCVVLGAYAANQNAADYFVAIGHAAGGGNTVGTNNTAIGRAAMNANDDGNENTAVGSLALNAMNGGHGNVAVGHYAGSSMSGSGSGNIFLGTQAGSASTIGSNGLYIGSNGGGYYIDTITIEHNAADGPTVTNKMQFADVIKSTVATGTAPFTIASTTLVTNLNADLLDGATTAVANTNSTIVLRDSSGRAQITDPSAAQDIASKNYVDTVAQGLKAKASVLCSTTANISLSGEQTLDGVVTSSSRVVVRHQAAPAENGIYVTAAGSWTRSTDFDAWSEIPSAFVFVEQGTLYGDCGFVCTSNTGGTIGVTSITWAQFSGAGSYTAGSGLTLTGTQFSIAAGAISNSMLANGAVANLSGTNTGDQTTISGNAGSATILATTRSIYGNNFNGSADLAQVIASTFGGTGNGFAKFSGPTTTEKTFTLPNANATILTDNAVVTVAQGGSGAATLTGILKGNGTSAFTAVTAPSGTIVGTSDTQTLTDKWVQKRTGSTTSSATPTINTDTVDFYELTAQAVDITSFTTNLTGTPVKGQTLWISIVGTAARAITWGAKFTASTLALPTTTVTTARLDVGFIWDDVGNTWRCIATA